MNVLVLLVVLCLKLFNGAVLLGLDLGDLRLTLGLHILSQASHFRLVLLLDLVGNALELLTLGGSQGIEVLVESVLVLSLTNFLLLLLHFKRAQVLLQLTFVNAVLVLSILKFDLALLLHHGLLIKVLEQQMLQSLPPNLDRDRIFLLQVLIFSILVTKLGLLIFFLFLSDEPKVVDSETLIVVLAGSDLLLLNRAPQGTALHAHRLLVLVVIIVIHSVGAG